MGKGDRRSRRGKIYNGSYGKRRPRDESKKAEVQQVAPMPAAHRLQRTRGR
jgi:30S ribosomal protein S31